MDTFLVPMSVIPRGTTTNGVYAVVCIPPKLTQTFQGAINVPNPDGSITLTAVAISISPLSPVKLLGPYDAGATLYSLQSGITNVQIYRNGDLLTPGRDYKIVSSFVLFTFNTLPFVITCFQNP
jgi:hypothetical protein